MINFIGVVLGAISVLFIYPLDDEIYGLAQFIYSTAFFLLPFGTMGVLGTIVKFFPKFKNAERKDNGFLTLITSMLIGALIFFFVLFFTLKGSFYLSLSKIGLNSDLIAQHEPVILMTMVLLAFIYIFHYHAQNYQRIVIPQIINGLLFKLALPVFVLLYVFQKIDVSEFTWLIVAFFACVLIGMVVYTIAMKQMKFSWTKGFVDKGLMKSMSVYSMYGSISTMGSMLALRMDSIMVATMISLSSNGIYNKVLFIAAIIDIPMRAIIQIASPIISDHCEKGNMKEIKKLYQQASLNLFVSGVVFFLFIWFVIDDVFGIAIDPTSFENGKMVFLFIAIGKLFDMLTSVNTQIILYSKLFRTNIIFILLLGVSNLVMNYYLIGQYDIVGAAMATCFAMILYNVVKYFYIWRKFGIQPLTFSIIKVILIGAFIYGILIFIPDTGSHILNIGLKAIIIVGLYAFLIVRLKVSQEITDLVSQILKRIQRK